jgi:hypothetical protein
LKHHFRDFVQVAFLDAKNEENDFARPMGTLKHRFIDITKFFFNSSGRLIMSSQGHSSA